MLEQTLRLASTFALISAVAAGTVACGDDDTTESNTSSSSSTGAGGMAAGGNGGAGGMGSGGMAAGGMGGMGAGGNQIDCSNLAAGPFNPEAELTVFGGSEDFDFDGMGNIAGKAGGGNSQSILLSDASGTTSTFASGGGDINQQAFGLRFMSNGNLAVALPGDGKVIQVTPAGVVSDIATGLGGVNGVHVDSQDTLWVTQLGAGRISKIPLGGAAELVASGADATAVNGIYLDEQRNQLFYTNYSAGKIRRTDPNNIAPVDVATIPGAALDGLAMDACGNIYAVDQGGNRVYRVQLDANGDAAGAAELLATTPLNIANANFGRGTGFDANKLYLAGNPGTVYSIDVGISGQ